MPFSAMERNKRSTAVRFVALFSGAWLVLITSRVQIEEGHARGCDSQAEQRHVMPSSEPSLTRSSMCTGVGGLVRVDQNTLRWVVKVRFVRDGQCGRKQERRWCSTRHRMREQWL